ncbi:hypothetical protein [Campylobacter concisus]|nr:hypothetical protein [Campylobacter concisus]
MIEHLLLFFALLAIIIALVMVSNRLKVRLSSAISPWRACH